MMHEYIVSFIMVSLVVAVVSVISPEGKMKKSVSFGISLTLICVLLSPIFDIFGKEINIGEDFFQYTDSVEGDFYTNEELENQTEKAMNSGIETAVSEKFGIEKSNIRAETSLHVIGKDVIIRKVVISLSGGGIFADLPKIKSYIETSLGTKCEVCLLD